MKKIFSVLVLLTVFSIAGYSQLMVSKLLGKNSGNSKIGYGLFTYFDFPLGETVANQSIRLELMDLAFFPEKSSDIDNTIGYISIKGGYKYVFSETQEGFYIEPQAGWCRVVNSNDAHDLPKDYGDGLALALEAGYSLGVGQSGNTINFGLKYESDRAGSAYTANSIGFRVSFSFHMFRRRGS